MSSPIVPATVADLDLNVISEALSRHGCNVSDAAKHLGVPPSDLRRLLWANPALHDQAFEVVEARLDLAEKNIGEALTSDDSRRRDAASTFTIRNSLRAKRRGWIHLERIPSRSQRQLSAARDRYEVEFGRPCQARGGRRGARAAGGGRQAGHHVSLGFT
jgi:Bacterial regulatory protein, Fis family